MSMARRAAILAAVLLGAVAVFQLALALGAPWGDMAYGGRATTTDGVLPASFRVMSAAAVLILLFAGWIVLARSEVVDPGPMSKTFVERATWVVFAYLILNTVMNLTSSHAGERWGMGLATFVAAVLSLIVARGGSGAVSREAGSTPARPD